MTAASRRDVRVALCRYISGADNPEPSDLGAWRGTAVANLGVLYDAPPREWPHEWAIPLDAEPGWPSGAMAYPFLHRSDENRMAGSRGAGWKRRAYDVELHVFYTSSRTDTSGALADLEDLIDSLTVRLEADPTLGGEVFSAGEGDVGSRGGAGSSIAWEQGEPSFESGGFQCWAVCRFGVVTHIQA